MSSSDRSEAITTREIDAVVIPHGNTWGIYSPPRTSWDKQLTPGMNDPAKQFLIEVMSGHGNSEEYRSWQDVAVDSDGSKHCPEPTPDYRPSCWRAGQIIEERCRKAGFDASECASRAATARQNYVDAGLRGAATVPGARPEEWLDAGQCKDCFIPAYNYRPGGSAQYALAITNFADPAHPQRFHFGLLASSDNHKARPGNGYKEFDRIQTTDNNTPRDERWRARMSRPPAATASTAARDSRGRRWSSRRRRRGGSARRCGTTGRRAATCPTAATS